jgi:hypothetical protein
VNAERALVDLLGDAKHDRRANCGGNRPRHTMCPISSGRRVSAPNTASKISTIALSTIEKPNPSETRVMNV